MGAVTRKFIIAPCSTFSRCSTFSLDKTVPRPSVQSSVFTPIVNKNDSVVTPIVNKNGKPDIIYKLCIKLVIANNMIVLSTHYKHNWIQATLEEYLF